MRRALLPLLLLLFAFLAQADPQITAVDPPVGFSYGATKVTLRGTDLAGSGSPCPFPPPGGCSVRVFFGGVQQFVNFISPTSIDVTVVPNNLLAGPTDHRVVDIRVEVSGKNPVTVPNAFTFDPFAVPGEKNFTPYLLPIIGLDARGAFGSVWRHEWTAYNSSVATLQVLAPFSFPIDPPTSLLVPPGGTERLVSYPLRQGAIVYVPNPLVDSTTMSLRTRDISENAESWGTELPILSYADFGEIHKLIDIPTDARYRVMLRIYSWDMAPQDVHVRIYDPAQAQPIRTFDVKLEGMVSIVPVDFPHDPAYAQLDLLTPEIRAATPAIRVEVENDHSAVVSPPPPAIWAFVSITNNETQQVTTITPRRR